MKRLAVVSVALCLLAGCGGGGTRIARSRLPQLVLQSADLPGFARLDNGPIGIADVSPGAREDLKRFGRVGGWKARYRGPRRLTVLSTADLFGSEGGAKQDVDAYDVQFQEEIVDSDAAEQFVTVPRIGARSLAVTIDGGGVRTSTIAWRFANATASVQLVGPVGLVNFSRLVALARRQERRLQAAIVKRS